MVILNLSMSFDSFPFIQIISLGGAAGAVDEETFISSFEEVKKVRSTREKELYPSQII